jgi:deoxycytidylate deaminase
MSKTGGHASLPELGDIKRDVPESTLSRESLAVPRPDDIEDVIVSPKHMSPLSEAVADDTKQEHTHPPPKSTTSRPTPPQVLKKNLEQIIQMERQLRETRIPRDQLFLLIAQWAQHFAHDVHKCNGAGAVFYTRHKQLLFVEYGVGRAHAIQRAAFTNGRRHLFESTLYISLFPCHHCLKVLENLGVRRIVVASNPDVNYEPDDCTEQDEHATNVERWNLSCISGIKVDIVDPESKRWFFADILASAGSESSAKHWFMALAFLVAQRSEDSGFAVGAVLTTSGQFPRVVSIGYNAKQPDVSVRVSALVGDQNRSLTDCTIVHAEANALLFQNCDVTELCLYSTLIPCETCKIYMNSNVKTVVYATIKPKHVLQGCSDALDRPHENEHLAARLKIVDDKFRLDFFDFPVSKRLKRICARDWDYYQGPQSRYSGRMFSHQDASEAFYSRPPKSVNRQLHYPQQ